MILGQINVLVATDVNVGDRSVDIRRVVPAALPEAVAVAVPSGYPVTEQIMKVDGRLEQLRMARLRGSRNEHMIAELVNRNGGVMIVIPGHEQVELPHEMAHAVKVEKV